MENSEVGTHNDKLCADSLTGNTLNTPQFIRPICPNWPIIWDIFWKKLSSHVHGRCRRHLHRFLGCARRL